MKKWMTLVFASMLALTLSLPGWSQTSTTGSKGTTQTSGEKKDNKKEAKKKKGKKGDKKGDDKQDSSKTTGNKK
jgi:hypothetical protein